MTGNQNAIPVTGGQQQPVLATAVEALKKVVLAELPELWPRLEACLSTSAALRLADLDFCPTLVLTGPSGCGKSTVIDLLERAKSCTTRVDSITSACFVTSASNMTRVEANEKDLLPKIRGRTMLTRDLSTVFRKNSDQLKDLFGVLIPILDGKGYAPGSGTQGLRHEAAGDFIFAWISASTPFASQTWDTQKQFGSRTLNYDIFKTHVTEEEMLAEDDAGSFKKKVEACGQPVATALGVIAAKRADTITKQLTDPLAAVGTVQWAADPQDIRRWRVRLARLVTAARCRSNANIESEDEDDPRRVVAQLTALTRGRAMLYDRAVVTLEDIPLAVHVALSSSRHGRVLRALAENPNGLCAAMCAKRFGWSNQTATNRMKDLTSRTGDRIAKWVTPSTGATGELLVPSGEFTWLGELKNLGLL
jgi:energy-coupling factor transporter ATP-binding protein EcfA2